MRECLQTYAGFYRAPRDIDETIALVGLQEKSDTLGAQLCGRQRRPLDVALAQIGDPDLTFLDEPTTGFDPSSRRAAWQVVAGLRSLGKTTLLTTHDMDDAEYLADRIAVIANGHIIAGGAPRTLGGREHMTTAISFTHPGGVATRDLPPGVRPLAEPRADGSIVLHTESPLVHLPDARRLGPAPGIRPARPGRPPTLPRRRLPVPDRLEHRKGHPMIISRLYRRLHARPSTQPQKRTASTTTQQGGAKGTATMALHLFGTTCARSSATAKHGSSPSPCPCSSW